MKLQLTNYETVAEPVPAGAELRVALVSCGKTKLAHPAPARDMYVGGLFKAARRYVEQGYDAWWILSARFGLVHPAEIIPPYEATLNGASLDELRTWVNKVDGRFRCSNYGRWSQAGGRLIVDIYAGKAYSEPLLREWANLSWEVNDVHHGLQIGQRLAAFAGSR